MATIQNLKSAMSAAPQNQMTVGQGFSDLVKRIDVVKKFEEVLGKKTPGFIASLLSLYNAGPQLKACDPKSILSQAMIAATLDLPINPALGFAAIVPYGKQAQFQIMVKGLIQLAIRTGVYQTINAAEVYEGEIVEHNRITGKFSIDENNKKSEKIVGYVAYFKLLSGFERYLYMTTEQIEAHARKYSKSFNNPNGPWKQNKEGMSLKTPLKLLISKFGILSVEMRAQGQMINENSLEKAIEYDQAVTIETSEGLKPTYPDNATDEPEIIPTENSTKPTQSELINDAIEPE